MSEIQTIEIDEVSIDGPFPKAVMSRVYDILRTLGYQIPDPESYQVPDNNDELVSGAAITPPFMHDDTLVSKLVIEGDIPVSGDDESDSKEDLSFYLKKSLKGHFGESTGSSNVTTLFQKFDMSLEETVEFLSESGQIDDAVKAIDYHADRHVNPVEVVGYAIATYAKGWLVERLLCQTDRFSKGSVSQDEGGLDVFDRKHDTWRQVKSVTCDDRVEGRLYYQFDMRGNLHIGDTLKDVNGSAVKVSEKGQEVGKTLAYRSCPHRYKFRDRGYRYLWW